MTASLAFAQDDIFEVDPAGYRSQIRMIGSIEKLPGSGKTFPDGWNDYRWGIHRQANSTIIHTSYSVAIARVGDPDVCNARYIETWCQPTGILALRKEFDIPIHAVESLEQAAELFNDRLSDGPDSVWFYDDPASIREQFGFFSGEYYRGAIGTTRLPVDSTSITADGYRYQYRFDESTGYLAELTSMMIPGPTGGDNPVGSGRESSKATIMQPNRVVYEKESVYQQPQTGEDRIRSEVIYYDTTSNPDMPSGVFCTPREGQSVVLMDNQQIEAQWRDGQVVRAYDETVVQTLATVQPPAGRAYLVWLYAGGVVLLGALAFWYTRTGTEARK